MTTHADAGEPDYDSMFANMFPDAGNADAGVAADSGTKPVEAAAPAPPEAGLGVSHLAGADDTATKGTNRSHLTTADNEDTNVTPPKDAKPPDERHGHLVDSAMGFWRGLAGGNYLNSARDAIANAVAPSPDYAADLPRADKMNKGEAGARVTGKTVNDSTWEEWYKDAAARHPISTGLGEGVGTGVLTTAATALGARAAPGVARFVGSHAKKLLEGGKAAKAAAAGLGIAGAHAANTLAGTTEKQGSFPERVDQVVADQKESPYWSAAADLAPVGMAAAGKYAVKPLAQFGRKWANTQLGRAIAGQGEGSVRLQEKFGQDAFNKLGDQARNLLGLTERKGIRKVLPPSFNTLSENANKVIANTRPEINALDHAIQSMRTGKMRTLPGGQQVPELVYDAPINTRPIKRKIAGNVESLRQGNEPVAAARVAGMLSKLRPRQGPNYRQPLKPRTGPRLGLNTQAGQPAPVVPPPAAPTTLNLQPQPTPLVTRAPGQPVVQTGANRPVQVPPAAPTAAPAAPMPPAPMQPPPSHVGAPPTGQRPQVGPIVAQTRIPPLTQLPDATPAPFPGNFKVPYEHFEVPPRPQLAPHAGPGARPDISQPNDMLGIMRAPMRDPFAGAQLPQPPIVTPAGAPIRGLPSTAPTPPGPGMPHLRPQPGPGAQVPGPVVTPSKPTPRGLPVMGSLPGPQPVPTPNGPTLPGMPHLFPQRGPGLPSNLPTVAPPPSAARGPYDPGPKHLTYGQGRRIERTQGAIKRHRDALHNKPSNIVDEKGRGPIYHGVKAANDQLLDDMVKRGVVPESYQKQLLDANHKFSTAAEHRKSLARSAVKTHGGHPEAKALNEVLRNQWGANLAGRLGEAGGTRMADPRFAAGSGTSLEIGSGIHQANEDMKKEMEEELNGTIK
jgi:hypothetical protein